MKDVNEILEQGIHGKKELKADEKRQYLGNFKERAYVAATLKDTQREDFWPLMEQCLESKEATLYIHSELSSNLQSQAIQYAQKYNRHFCIVSRQQKPEADTIVFVYADTVAVHIDDPAFNVQFKEQEIPTPPKKTKSSLWKRLFK